MRTIKRLGASLLAMGLVAVGMVATAPLASAHTGTLATSAVCNDDGTYRITYAGETHSVPTSGPGHVANLTIGEVLPAGSTISDVPPTVTGNTTYTFHQTVAGTATHAQATAFLVWGDGSKSDPIGKIDLPGNCKPVTPVAPSGNLQKDCVDNAGHVFAGKLDNGTAANVSWRLVTGTNDSHNTVVAGPTSGKPLEANNLPDATKVWLQYKTGDTWVDEGSVVTTGNCTPVTPVPPSGTLSTDCVEGAGHVVTADLDSGTFEGVSWRLVSGTNDSHTTVVAGPSATGPLEANGLADATTVWLQYKTGDTWVDEGSVVTTGNCTPVTPVPPSGTLSTDCVEGAGQVVTADLDSGTFENVSWRLVSGTIDSHTTVVAGPSTTGPLQANGLADATTVWLQYTTGDTWVDEGSVVTTGNCTPVISPTGSYTVVCSESGALVTVGTLAAGTVPNVAWQLTVNGVPHVVQSGDVLVVPALAALALQYTIGEGDSVTVQESNAPAACVPQVPATGSFTVICTESGADVTIGPLDSGTQGDVVWTLTHGGVATTVSSGDVVAVPALSALALSYVVGNGPSTTVQEGVAPEACGPTGERSLGIVKSVSPTGPAKFGDTLTYTLIVSAGGNLGQTNVSVSDYIPGYKPGRDSGRTTYVPGSAACDAGTCTTAYDGSAKLVTWGLGDMAAGTSRTVTFQVVIDTPIIVNSFAEVPSGDIFNTATVSSTETPNTPSNEVVTPVTDVLGVIHSKPPTGNVPAHQPTAVLGVSLPHTGAPAQLPWTLSLAGLLLVIGSSLIFIARKPETATI